MGCIAYKTVAVWLFLEFHNLFFFLHKILRFIHISNTVNLSPIVTRGPKTLWSKIQSGCLPTQKEDIHKKSDLKFRNKFNIEKEI